jgi:non-ribosomal peptide synthase protein (TIGR01720 family)
MVVDGVSWRILVEDMGRALEQVERGEAIELGEKTSSYRRWAERLEEYASSAEAGAEREYWSEMERWAGNQLPVDYPNGENTIGLSSSVVEWLDADATRALLQEVPEAYRTQINDVLLTALVEAMGKWSGRRQVLVDMEGHGRSDELFDDIDLSRTVGWFTSVYPVLLNLEGIEDLGASLKHVKEHLRSIPNRGIGYGILKYLNPSDDAVEKSKKSINAEVSFNYLGQMDHVMDEDSLFAGAPESQGAMQSERGQRRYLLEITMVVVGGRLQVQWSYGRELHAKETIERLANEYLEALRRLIAHCQSGETQGFTASDFSLVQFDEDELDQILNEVEFEGV